MGVSVKFLVKLFYKLKKETGFFFQEEGQSLSFWNKWT